MASLSQASELADTIAGTVAALIAERDELRRELAGNSAGSVSRDKSLVGMFRDNVCSREVMDEAVMRLERLLWR